MPKKYGVRITPTTGNRWSLAQLVKDEEKQRFVNCHDRFAFTVRCDQPTSASQLWKAVERALKGKFKKR